MPEETLGEIASLLEEAMNSHDSIRQVILSTKEGVIVASLSRDEKPEPRILSTVSAALIWAGSSTFQIIGQKPPSYFIQETSIEKNLTIVLPNYQLIVVFSKGRDAGFDMEEVLTNLQSIATRCELTMSSTSSFGKQTILGRLVEEIPEINQAMILTAEGLPLGSVGITDDIEIAALVSSIFSNGLTFSPEIKTITFAVAELRFLIFAVDDKRLLAVVCRDSYPDTLCERVRQVLLSI